MLCCQFNIGSGHHADPCRGPAGRRAHADRGAAKPRGQELHPALEMIEVCDPPYRDPPVYKWLSRPIAAVLARRCSMKVLSVIVAKPNDVSA